MSYTEQTAPETTLKDLTKIDLTVKDRFHLCDQAENILPC